MSVYMTCYRDVTGRARGDAPRPARCIRRGANCAKEPRDDLSRTSSDRRGPGQIPTLLRCRGYLSGLDPLKGDPHSALGQSGLSI